MHLSSKDGDVVVSPLEKIQSWLVKHSEGIVDAAPYIELPFKTGTSTRI